MAGERVRAEIRAAVAKLVEEEKTPLSLVEKEVGSTGSEQNAAARVTVEQQIARNLTITYVSNVSSTQQQVIQVEYNVDRNVSIVGLRDQNGTFGIDIKIKKRF